MDKYCLDIIVKGRVQGVCFRYYTKQAADRLGIKGWVRNLSNGDVEVFACGDKTSVIELLHFCKNGPPSAHVLETVCQERQTDGELKGFEIRY
jgi:acylphosphatase